MTYKEVVLDVFVEDQGCKGMKLEEAIELTNKHSFEKIERYLINQGYDLKEIHNDAKQCEDAHEKAMAAIEVSNSVVNVKNDYKPEVLTVEVAQGNSAIVVKNENNEVFNTLTVFNKNMDLELVAIDVQQHYETKYKIMNIMKAMYNKYKVKGLYSMDDIEHLSNELNGWIVKDTAKKDIEYITKAVKNNNMINAYGIFENLRQYIGYSVPKLDSEKIYLFTSY